MKRVLVAMSGGVDSSVAAALLKKQGYDVVGVTMKLLDTKPADECAKSCCGFDASRDARLVADSIGIPHYTMNTVDVFAKTVIDDFVDQYKKGLTPNPCVRCNRYVKFDYLMKKANELDCEFLATGHYALRQGNKLLRGVDPAKDQSYFLYVIYGSAIERVLFPVGDTTKQEIRRIAAEFGLVTAQKPESQDICFVSNGDYALLLGDTGCKEGPIVDMHGKIVGSHTGIHQYTIGQRKGLGALGKRMFVRQIRLSDNTVVVGEDTDMFFNSITVGDAVFCKDMEIRETEEYMVQVRYRGAPSRAKVKIQPSGILDVRFIDPVRAVACGQSAVIYQDNIVVGGGIIETAQ